MRSFPRRLIALLMASGPWLAATAEPLLDGASLGEPPSAWHVSGLPRQTKPFTRFSVVDLEGRHVLKIEADRSYGNLVRPLAQVATPAHLAWQWRVEKALPDTDLSQRGGDDTEIKVCVFFDEPVERLSFGDRTVLRVARARSAEPVPTATICYVWDSHLPKDTAIDSPFTRRLRYLVLQSGTDRLDHWVAERRDLAADFLRLFGAECDTVPPITGVAVGADADNTHGHSVAYVDELRLEP